MLTLAVDASTYAGSVALLQETRVVAEREAAMRGEREERLMPAVAAVLREGGVAPADLDRVACGAGPGSFTSLRIAASIAKAIASVRRVPLVVAPSPLLMIAGSTSPLPGGRYLATLDAMRGDVFALEVQLDADGVMAVVGDPVCVSLADATARAAETGASIIGPSTGVAPHARGFAGLIEHGVVRLVDASTWEPEYGRKAEAQVRWEAAHGRALEGA